MAEETVTTVSVSANAPTVPLSFISGRHENRPTSLSMVDPKIVYILKKKHEIQDSGHNSKRFYSSSNDEA